MQFSVSTIANMAALLSYTAHAAVVESRAVASVTGWDYRGCKTDSVQARALTGSFYFDELMTVEKCAQACTSFTYMAVEECFCGNTINSASVAAPETECSFKCLGKPSDQCGAAPRINLYQKSTSTTPSTPTVPNFVSQGCYTDNTNNRALKGAVWWDNLMTLEKCASICSGWTFFGTEWGRECYCSNALTSGSSNVAATECSKPCAGKSTQTCGDSLRLNLYRYGNGNNGNGNNGNGNNGNGNNGNGNGRGNGNNA